MNLLVECRRSGTIHKWGPTAWGASFSAAPGGSTEQGRGGCAEVRGSSTATGTSGPPASCVSHLMTLWPMP